MSSAVFDDAFFKTSYGIARDSMYVADVSIGLLGYACSFWWLRNKTKSTDATFAAGSRPSPAIRHSPCSPRPAPFDRNPGAAWGVSSEWRAERAARGRLARERHLRVGDARLRAAFQQSHQPRHHHARPYRFVRHPAYAAKLVAWGCEAAPSSAACSSSSSRAGRGSTTRALTEERHLSADPGYRAYCAAVKRRFVPASGSHCGPFALASRLRLHLADLLDHGGFHLLVVVARRVADVGLERVDRSPRAGSRERPAQARILEPLRRSRRRSIAQIDPSAQARHGVVLHERERHVHRRPPARSWHSGCRSDPSRRVVEDRGMPALRSSDIRDLAVLQLELTFAREREVIRRPCQLDVSGRAAGTSFGTAPRPAGRNAAPWRRARPGSGRGASHRDRMRRSPRRRASPGDRRAHAHAIRPDMTRDVHGDVR